METVLIQSAVTIVTTLFGYAAVVGKLNLLLREVGKIKREQSTEKQIVSDLREEVRILKLVTHEK